MIALPSPLDENRHPKKEAFLAAYSKLGNISAAAKAAKIDRHSHYLWMDDGDEYRERFADAHQQACEALETEARRRAVTGTLKPIYQGGKKVGAIREFSDTLLIFLMKAAMPYKYRERYEPSDQQLLAALDARVRRLASAQQSSTLIGNDEPTGAANGNSGMDGGEKN